MREPVKERPVSLKSDVVWELYNFLVKTNPPVFFLNKKDENGFWNEEVLYVRDIELINYGCSFDEDRIGDVQFGIARSKEEGVTVYYTDRVCDIKRGTAFGSFLFIRVNALNDSRSMQELLEAKRLRLPTEEESEKYRKIIKEYFEENADMA